MESDRARALADGNSIPMLGLGVWQVEDSRECVDAVRWALEAGYRHIDTAQAYGNEESVGVGLRESGVPREEIFVTTKFFPRRDDPVAELEASLRRLGLDYVDLYIIHWPAGGPLRAWPGMERARKLGHTRSIGVSNFDTDEIDTLVESAEQPPVINQVQFNPFAYRKKLLEACLANNVAVEAYSPLGTGRHLNDSTVVRIATRHERTPRRSSSAGEFSTAFRRSRNPPTSHGSPKTRRSSTSCSRTRTWARSTGSTEHEGPAAPARTSGGASYFPDVGDLSLGLRLRRSPAQGLRGVSSGRR